MLLTLTSLVLLFSSCEKNPDIVPELTTAEILIGSWQESSSTLTLYTSSSTKISEEAQPLRKASFYTNGKFDYRYVNEEVLEGTYKLSAEGNTEYINFQTAEDALTFKIVQVSPKTLTVSCETHNVIYYIDDEPHVAATSIRTMILSKL